MNARALARLRGQVLAAVLQRARVDRDGRDAGAQHSGLLLERGLMTLAETWRLEWPPRIGRAPTVEQQRSVLVDARAAAAVLVLARQLAGPTRVEQLHELEGCVACFRHLHAALAEPGAADPIAAVIRPPVRVGGPIVGAATHGLVLANQLDAVRTRIRGIELILTGRAPLIVPTLSEEAALRRELREEDLVERGLSELVPQLWPLRRMQPGRVRRVDETGVLVQLRALAASVAVLLQQPESPSDPGRLAVATALFRHLDRELQRIGYDAAALTAGVRPELNRTIAFALTGWRRGPL